MQDGVAEFLLGAAADASAQLMHQRLHPVADAQDGQSALENPVGDAWRALFVDAGRAAGQYDAPRVYPLNLLPRVGGTGDFGVDLQFPDTAGDEVAVLGTEINNGDTLIDLTASVGAGRIGLDAAGDFQIRRDLQIITGGNPSAYRQLVLGRSKPP